MIAGLIGGAASTVTQKDASSGSMINVMGRGQTAAKATGKGSKTKKAGFILDTFMGGGLGLFGGGGGGGDEIELPPFFADPYFTESQDYLFNYGQNILEGNLNDFFSSIGAFNPGGEEFENMLALINRDTSKAVDESLVRRGISRSGVGLSTTAKASADVNTKLRWEDYNAALNRSLQGKEFLMGTGLDTMSGVRTAGLNNQSQVNQFNLAEVGIGINAQQIMDQRGQQSDAMWGNLLNSAIGAVGSYMGTKGGTTNTGTSNIAGSNYNLAGLTGFKGTSATPAYGSAAYYGSQPIQSGLTNYFNANYAGYN